MASDSRYDYSRYLQAKRSVDSRSINRHVLDTLQARLDRSQPMRILEIGGGTGSMVRRCLDYQLSTAAHYTLVDRDADTLASFDDGLRADARAAGYTLDIVHADIEDFLLRQSDDFDLVIANAVIDLLDVPSLLAQLRPRCAPDALLWFTINFDGESCFLPARRDDDRIWQAYHASMNRPPGQRYAGRNLLQTLSESGAALLASGSSDWVVHAIDGAYLADESYFLHHIVYTIDNELRGAPPIASADFARWIVSRHQDIEEARLIYIAHQLDVLSKLPPAQAI